MSLGKEIASMNIREIAETVGLFHGLDSSEKLVWEVASSINENGVVACDLYYFDIRLCRLYVKEGEQEKTIAVMEDTKNV